MMTMPRLPKQLLGFSISASQDGLGRLPKLALASFCCKSVEAKLLCRAAPFELGTCQSKSSHPPDRAMEDGMAKREERIHVIIVNHSVVQIIDELLMSL